MKGKIEKKYVFNGEEYDLERVYNGVYIYSSDYSVILCDENGNVIADIEADCSQNVGFLKYTDYEL